MLTKQEAEEYDLILKQMDDCQYKIENLFEMRSREYKKNDELTHTEITKKYDELIQSVRSDELKLLSKKNKLISKIELIYDDMKNLPIDLEYKFFEQREQLLNKRKTNIYFCKMDKEFLWRRYETLNKYEMELYREGDYIFVKEDIYNNYTRLKYYPITNKLLHQTWHNEYIEMQLKKEKTYILKDEKIELKKEIINNKNKENDELPF